MALRCKRSLSAYVGGRPRVVKAGALVQDDDPIVLGRESLFESVDGYLAKQRPGGVESATAEPGEKRDRTTPAEPKPAAGRGRPRGSK